MTTARPVTVELRDGDFLLRLSARTATLRGELLELRDVIGDFPAAAADIVTVPLHRVVMVVGQVGR